MAGRTVPEGGGCAPGPFLEAAAAGTAGLFGGGRLHGWIGVHVLAAGGGWKDTFRDRGLEEAGGVWRFEIPSEAGGAEACYIHELEEGFLMLVSASADGRCPRALCDIIRRSRGITHMWMPPYSFADVIHRVRSDRESALLSFTARRERKPGEEAGGGDARLVSRSGGGVDALYDDMVGRQGAAPVSAGFDIGGEEVRMDCGGTFAFRAGSAGALGAVMVAVDRALPEQRRLVRAARGIRSWEEPYDPEDRDSIMIPGVSAGMITFCTRLDARTVQRIFDRFEDGGPRPVARGGELTGFSFVDTLMREDSPLYSASATDNDKGSMFGVGGGEKSMTLSPHYNVTFESFLNLYRMLSEEVDGDCRFALANEVLDNAKWPGRAPGYEA